MAEKLEFENKNGNTEAVTGSDKRLDVSARSDTRDFYVSRDGGSAYTAISLDSDAVAGDLIAYLKNDSSTLRMYIRDIKVCAANAATFKVFYGNDTAATGGNTVTPTNLNTNTTNKADVTARGDGALGGVSAGSILGTARVAASTGAHIGWNDALILGQDQNIVVEYDAGTTGAAEVQILFYMDSDD